MSSIQEEKEIVVKCAIFNRLNCAFLNKEQNDLFRIAFKKAVESRVYAFSKRFHKASLAYNLLIRELFYGNRVKDVIIPEALFDQTFIRQLMLGTDGARQPFQEIVSFYERYPSLLDNGPRYLGDRNIYSDGADIYLTNMKNYLVMNFLPIIKRHIMNHPKLQTLEDKNFVLFTILGNEKSLKALVKKHDITISMYMRQVINGFQELLQLKTDEEVTEKWVKKNLTKVLQTMVYIDRMNTKCRLFCLRKSLHSKRKKTRILCPKVVMKHYQLFCKVVLPKLVTKYSKKRKNTITKSKKYKSKRRKKQVFENFIDQFIYNNRMYLRTLSSKRLYKLANRLKIHKIKKRIFTYKKKLFRKISIAPMAQVKTHLINIDKSVLYGINLELQTQKILSISPGSSKEYEDWQNFIDVSDLTTRTKVFTGSIETDGVAMCVHFRRKELPIKQVYRIVDKEPLKGKRLIGIDPGRSNIFYGVEILEDNSKKIYKFTRGEYNSIAGIWKFLNKVKDWNKNIKESVDALSKTCSKGSSYKSYCKYLRVMYNCLDNLWEEQMKTHWRQSRLRVYGGKKRAFSRFFQKFKRPGDNREIVIAYGSAKFDCTGKGEVAVPTSRAFKECKLRFKVIVVDEFRTTRIYWENNEPLYKVSEKKLNGYSEVVRGLLWCSSTSNQKVNKFVNRDLNGALNILRCAKGDRPEIMCRSSKIELPTYVVKKQIIQSNPLGSNL